MDDPGSSVRISFDDVGISAYVSMAKGEWYMEPACESNGTFAPGVEVVYSGSDVVANPSHNLTDIELPNPREERTEGTQLSTGSPVSESGEAVSGIEANAAQKVNASGLQAAPMTASQQVLSYRELRMFAVTDNQFRDHQSWIEDRINTVNGWYSQVGIQIRIMGYWDWPHDDTNDNDIDAYLATFRNAVRSLEGAVTGYDLCVLFAGRVWEPIPGYWATGSTYIRGAETGLGEPNRAQYGFSVISMLGWGGSNGRREELIAHEVGHSVNGIHSQADTISGQSTLMTQPMPPSGHNLHRFSDGTAAVNHNNAQRIRAWANMNLHSIVWTQAGGDYGSMPGDQIKLLNLRVRVMDLPGTQDQVQDVQYDLKYTGGAWLGITISEVYVSLHDPWNYNPDFGWVYNVHIGWGGRTTITPPLKAGPSTASVRGVSYQRTITATGVHSMMTRCM